MTGAMDVGGAIEVAAQEELARRRLLDFGRLVYPGFQAPPHIRFIAELLERMEAGELRKICVSVPVRHGKSVLCSQIFPAWYLGRHPTASVIMTSHAESLVRENSSAAKRLVEDDRWPFSAVQMSADSSAVQRWRVTDRGGVYGVGVGGSITGRGANLLICDDAVHDGLSQTERNSVWRWFTEVAVPRLEPGGATIVIGARFAGDDLIGRIQDSEDASDWIFVRLPAIAEENDPLGRAPGEALWPERMSLAELEQRRVSMQSSAAFSAQFQQDPLPPGGLMFKSEWLQHRFDRLPEKRIDNAALETNGLAPVTEALWQSYGVKPRQLAPLVIQACDSAWKEGPSADRTAIATIVSDGVNFCISDVWADRVDYIGLKRVASNEYEKHHPSRLFVEEAASGFALVAELKRTTGIPVIGVTPGRESKEARAEAVTGLFEAGRVLWPRCAPWLDDALSEFARFPYGKHDDVVDAVVLGITQAQRIVRHGVAEARWRRQNADLLNGDWIGR